MAVQSVLFQYFTGLKRPFFHNVRLRGNWDASGRLSENWNDLPMREITGEDGCPAFEATASLEVADGGKTLQWGVLLDGPQGANLWGIPTEVQDVESVDRLRQFQLRGPSPTPQVERYYLTYLRRLGANKYSSDGNSTQGLRFEVWAPSAKKVEVVFAGQDRGYIADDGSGIDPAQPVIELSGPNNGFWEGLAPGNFARFMSLPYMYRIQNAQNKTVYRTDIFSRSQIGRGDINPAKSTWPGTVDTLAGTKSCSVVIDPDVVRRNFAPTPSGARPDLISDQEFWSSEFQFGHPVPNRLQDLVIYELHVGSLGISHSGPGNLSDAMNFLDHLVDLGVNAVELLPMAQFSGTVGWGYGDSHHLCIESSAGGRDQYRHFVRACHRRGIAVLQDVVYNHYDPDAERSEWAYDSTVAEQNIYYWYEGRTSDYRSPDGGYLDNGSTGFTPRFWEEVVRQQFISAAAFLIEEMHVDGLRVDLTQAIHRDNQRHSDGRPISAANIFGQKLLREWSRTLRMIRPDVMLVAEDHTGWDAVTKSPAQGGLGFSARWEVAFYHNLIGDSDMAGNRAKLLKAAGFGGDQPLEMDIFSGALYGTRYDQVVFHESHDEAGNSGGTARTMVTAVNQAPTTGVTRTWAEARSRLCFGLSLLSAGTPMFFMGEEIAAQKPYRFNDFLRNREDIIGERTGNGKAMFRFYREAIALSRRFHSVRTQNIDILHESNDNRVIAFKRWDGGEEILIVASFNNRPFDKGYLISKDPLAIPSAGWKEVFNSDSVGYGGQNVGNASAIISSDQGRINAVIPANGFVVLVKQ